MESDSIRASGSDTLVDIWIDGKLRAIRVSLEAIGGFLGFDQASGMSDRDRCEFVRAHLPLVLSAAKGRLRDTSPLADSVTLECGHLPANGRPGERRKTERRNADRRKVNLGRAANQPERRRNARRQSERRSGKSKSK